MFEHPVECGVRNERKERKFLLKHDLRVKKVILRVLNCMTLVSVCFRLSKQCERHFHINVVDGKSFLRRTRLYSDIYSTMYLRTYILSHELDSAFLLLASVLDGCKKGSSDYLQGISFSSVLIFF